MTKLSGLCRRCRKNPAPSDRAQCNECLAKSRKHQLQRARQFTLRITPDEYAAVAGVAHEWGETPRAWFRRVLWREAEHALGSSRGHHVVAVSKQRRPRRLDKANRSELVISVPPVIWRMISSAAALCGESVGEWSLRVMRTALNETPPDTTVILTRVDARLWESIVQQADASDMTIDDWVRGALRLRAGRRKR